MTPEQRRYIKEEFKDLTDHELLRQVALEEAEFLPEAMEIAREQLELRNIKALDAKGYYAQFPEEDPAFGFCNSCLEQTTPEEPGYCSFRPILGPSLRGYDLECKTCGSFLVTKWYCIMGFPVQKLEQYRVLIKKRSFPFSEVYRRVKARDA